MPPNHKGEALVFRFTIWKLYEYCVWKKPAGSTTQTQYEAVFKKKTKQNFSNPYYIAQLWQQSEF